MDDSDDDSVFGGGVASAASFNNHKARNESFNLSSGMDLRYCLQYMIQ